MKKGCISSFLVLLFIQIPLLGQGELTKTKEDSYYHFLMGSSLRSEGLLNQAEQEFIKAVEGSVDPAVVLSVLSQLYFEMWKWEKSESTARKALSFDPKNVQAHEVIGRIFMARAFSGRKEGTADRSLALLAKDEFLTIISLSPDNERAYFSLGRISIALAQVDEAEHYYSRLTEVNPFSEVGFSLLGELQLDQRKLDEAEKNLAKALRINPRNYKGYVLLGKCFEMKNLPDSAIPLYERALELFPQDVFFLNQLGFNLYLERNYEKASLVLESVLKVETTNPQALLTKAKILSETKKYTDAEGTYRTLIESHQDNLGARINFAVFLEEKGDFEAAIIEYQKLLEKDKEPSKEMLFFYHFRLGILYERLQKFSLAKQYLKKSIDINSRSAEALNYLGYIMAEREENLEEAVELIKKALLLDPQNGAYLDSLGWAYFKLKDYRRAEIYLKKAISRLKNDPVINDHLGDLYFQLEDKKNAVLFWEKALENNSDNTIRIKLKIEKIRKK
jgi:tetratricopeptide (TPR) repeat protein